MGKGGQEEGKRRDRSDSSGSEPATPAFPAWVRTPSECLAELGVSADRGLSAEEAAARLRRYGPNELKRHAAPSVWKLVLEQFDDTLMRILLAAAVVSFVLALYDGAEGGEVGATAFVEPLVIFLILIINAVVGVWQESNAEKALEVLWPCPHGSLHPPTTFLARSATALSLPHGRICSSSSPISFFLRQDRTCAADASPLDRSCCEHCPTVFGGGLIRGENGVQEDWNGRAERRDRVHGVREAVVPQLEQPMIQHVAVDNNNVRGNTNEANDVAEESDADDQGDSEYGFVLRILLLLVLAWITLLIFNAGMIVIPISLGRMVFEAVPRLPISHGIKCNDLFSFSIGCYIIWSAAAGTRYAIDYIRSRQLGFLVQQICKWCSIVLKSSALLSIWIFVIPVLIGLLFELLVIVPMRVPIDESPVFLLYQDWALGLIFLKIWTRLKNPGLSAYANDPQKAAESLVSLLEEAEKVVPMELREQTPVRVGATAGLRALGTERSEEILQAVRDLLRDKSSFKSQPDWVTVLDGSQEGAFQWVTINYLLGKLGKPYSHTVGVVDLGGGSVQMAYAISEKDAAKAPQVSDGEGSYVNKLLLKGTTYYLYVHSYLHYGLLAARAEILKAGEGNDYSNCMLQGHHGKYKYGDDTFEASGLSSGASYSKCRAVAVRALKVDEPACTYMKCTFGGVWNGGGGDGQKNLFVASFFFDRAAEAGFVNPKESVAKVKPSDFEEAARRVCKLNVKDAQATYPDVSEENIPYLCMDLVYQYTLLVDGFGVDPYQDIMLVKKVPYSNSFVEAAWPLGSAIEVASSP